jgi:hypothetical protein
MIARLRGSTVGLVLAAFGAACIYTSRSPSNDPNVLSPRGASGVVRVGLDLYEGELLAATSYDYVMLLPKRLVVIPYSIAWSAEFKSVSIRATGDPSNEHLTQLRYASRFPYGIPAPAMTAILGTTGQNAPDTIRAATKR